MALLVCSSAEVDLSESSSGGGLGWTMLTHAVSLGNHKRVRGGVSVGQPQEGEECVSLGNHKRVRGGVSVGWVVGAFAA